MNRCQVCGNLDICDSKCDTCGATVIPCGKENCEDCNPEFYTDEEIEESQP